jgi:hypothetical protein
MVRLLSIAAILAWTLMPAGPALAAPFTNGSFEQIDFHPDFAENRPFMAGSTMIVGWTVVYDTIDVLGQNYQADDGLRSVSLNAFVRPGQTESAGGIHQVFDTLPGHVYDITFAVAPHPDGGQDFGLEVRWKSHTTVTREEFFYPTVPGITRTNVPWTDLTIRVVSGGDLSDIIFRSLVDGEFGPLLDNVRVTDVTDTLTAVPEPATLTLIALGLAALPSARRRRA